MLPTQPPSNSKQMQLCQNGEVVQRFPLIKGASEVQRVYSDLHEQNNWHKSVWTQAVGLLPERGFGFSHDCSYCLLPGPNLHSSPAHSLLTGFKQVLFFVLLLENV